MIDTTVPVNLPPQGTHSSDGLRAGATFAGGGNISVDPNTGALSYTDIPTGYTQGAPGVAISPRYTYRCTPQLANAYCVSYNNEATTGGGAYLLLGAVSPYTYPVVIGDRNAVALDVPRTLYFTRQSSTGSANVTVFAYDCGNVLYAEQIIIPNGQLTGKSNRAAKYVIGIYVTTNDYWAAGTGPNAGASTFGLPYYVQTYGDIYPVYNASVIASSSFTAGDTTNPPTLLTGDPRGTVTFTPVANGILTVDMYVQGADNPSVNPNYSTPATSQANLTVGVPQYIQPFYPGLT